LRRHRARDRLGVPAIHERERQTEPRPNVPSSAGGSTVNVSPHTTWSPARAVSPPHPPRQAGAEREPVAATLERGRCAPTPRVWDSGYGRIHALCGPGPPGRGGSLIDRRHDGPGQRIRSNAGVDGACAEPAPQVLVKGLTHSRNVPMPFAPSKRALR
jgi:hypothetical protein